MNSLERSIWNRLAGTAAYKVGVTEGEAAMDVYVHIADKKNIYRFTFANSTDGEEMATEIRAGLDKGWHLNADV